MTGDPELVGGRVDPAADALQRSSALTAVGRHAEAEAQLLGALSDLPDDPLLRTELARVLLLQGRGKDALPHAERAVAAAPEFAYAHAIRALVLSTDLRRKREAVDAAREAVRIDPEDPFCHLTLARACLRSRWFPEGLDAADRAVRLDPERSDAHSVRGAALLALDRDAEAEAAYREALRLDPGDADALNDLAIAVRAQGKERGAEARGLFEDAARADPEDAVARGNLASDARSWVNGRWGWAVVAFAVFRALGTLTGDTEDRTSVAIVWAAIAAGVTVFLLVRAARRRAALSPAARRLLDDQSWTDRVQLSRWRPIWWFIPAPVWLGISVVLAAVAVVGLTGAPRSDGLWFLLALAIAVGIGTGRRTWRLHGEPRWARRPAARDPEA
ncbi:tetratricopeptide repeat protein [Patulibacter minatonensis]|uniref:tetratricopeptide repeat protein n=1 Tax=Patulibacter minatonensis TaxID=298163 RepID=UPI0004B72753|nr:tetratricopeptide repeat protein [Patulibacter minatonensis]